MIDRLGELDPEDRSTFVKGMIGGVSSGNPALASSLAAWLTPADLASQAGGIASAIAFRDPGAAAQFVRNLPPSVSGKQRSGALRRVVEDWAYEDPAAAAGFVATLPTGDERDAVSEVLSRQLRKFDLEAATRVLSGVSGADARGAMIRELAGAWMQVDANRGRTALTPFLRSAADREQAKEILPR